jgi:transcription antitermination factor NusA-like protein
MDAETIEKLRQMLGVPIDKVEEKGEEILVHVPKAQVAKAIGSGGSVVRSAELILKKKLTIEESTSQ